MRLSQFVLTLGAILLVTLLATSCGGDDSPAAVDLTPAPGMTVASDAFVAGGSIPVDYTCDGRNVSPPISWSGAPSATQAFVLLVTDPDAPGKSFDHWVVYDIQPDTASLAVAASGTTDLASIATEGTNDFGHEGYGGPCPPKGSMHNHVFHVYALSAPLEQEDAASREAVDEAMAGKVIARGELIGRFGR